MTLTSNPPEFRNPNAEELKIIEDELHFTGITVEDYFVAPSDFFSFFNEFRFGDCYFGGPGNGLYEEKVLEHYIGYDLLKLSEFSKADVYLDMAASSSPWIGILRDKLNPKAYAVDLHILNRIPHHAYYIAADAANTPFKNSTVKGISLQCAFEEFLGRNDTRFVHELARLLKPGGKAVISPLYMHTHHCGFSSSDYWGKGYADEDATEYITRDHDRIKFARFYDVPHLLKRIIETILPQGLQFRLLVLRNKHDIHTAIYCHFILEITKCL